MFVFHLGAKYTGFVDKEEVDEGKDEVDDVETDKEATNTSRTHYQRNYQMSLRKEKVYALFLVTYPRKTERESVGETEKREKEKGRNLRLSNQTKEYKLWSLFDFSGEQVSERNGGNREKRRIYTHSSK